MLLIVNTPLSDSATHTHHARVRMHAHSKQFVLQTSAKMSRLFNINTFALVLLRTRVGTKPKPWYTISYIVFEL